MVGQKSFSESMTVLSLTNSVMNDQPTLIVDFETVTLTTVTRVGCFVVYRHVRNRLKASSKYFAHYLLALTSFKFKSDGHWRNLV